MDIETREVIRMIEALRTKALDTINSNELKIVVNTLCDILIEDIKIYEEEEMNNIALDKKESI